MDNVIRQLIEFATGYGLKIIIEIQVTKILYK